MTDTSFPLNRQARIWQVDSVCVSSVPTLRVYGVSPESSALQIRVLGPTTESRSGVARPMIAQASMSLSELRQLRDMIDSEVARLSGSDAAAA